MMTDLISRCIGCRCQCAFIAARPLAPPSQRSVRPSISMKKGKKQPRSPQQLPPEKRARLAKIAAEFGVEAPKPGSQFDKKYNTPEANEQDTTLYQTLAGSVGQENLDTAEKAVYYILAGLLSFVIAVGLAFSTEAFYKATGKEIPAQLDAAVAVVEGLFTPALIAFFAFSSVLGLYKQSELTSGATSYSEKDE